MPDTEAFTEIPVEIMVTVGKAHPTINELLDFKGDEIVPLDTSINDLVELFIGDKLIGRGELVELDGAQEGQLAVKLQQITEKPSAS